MGYIGFRLGLSGELVKLAGFVGGFFVSFRYYQGVGDFIAQRTFLSVEWAAALAMAALMGLVGFATLFCLRFLEKIVQISFQAKFDKVGGLLVGLFRAILAASVILVIFRQLPSDYLNASIEERSLSGRFISRVAPAVYDAASPRISRFLSFLQGRSS